jgi:hypothetical protein
MYDIKEAFNGLPNAKVIWFTDDGQYHLHSANGGIMVTREEAFKESVTKEGTKEKFTPQIKKK